MLGEQRHTRERLVARAAAVSLDAGVCLQVRAQVGPVGERALAVGTLERLLAGVRPHVTLQQPRSRERLATQRTPARQRVRPNVHLERSLCAVHLRINRQPIYLLVYWAHSMGP